MVYNYHCIDVLHFCAESFKIPWSDRHHPNVNWLSPNFSVTGHNQKCSQQRPTCRGIPRRYMALGEDHTVLGTLWLFNTGFCWNGGLLSVSQGEILKWKREKDCGFLKGSSADTILNGCCYSESAVWREYNVDLSYIMSVWIFSKILPAGLKVKCVSFLFFLPILF